MERFSKENCFLLKSLMAARIIFALVPLAKIKMISRDSFGDAGLNLACVEKLLLDVFPASTSDSSLSRCWASMMSRALKDISFEG